VQKTSVEGLSHNVGGILDKGDSTFVALRRGLDLALTDKVWVAVKVYGDESESVDKGKN